MINYDQILETALIGIRRTAVFIGFGINAASNPQCNDYSLTNITAIQIVPDKANASTVNCYKEQFASWIVGCGLRELIETFSVFLDQICSASLHVSVHKGGLTSQKALKVYNKFSHKGIKAKLQTLEEQFGIQYEHSDCINSINLVRNCITHRLGRVAKRDCDNNSHLILKWLSFDIIAKSRNGGEMTLEFPTSDGYVCEEGTAIVVKTVERKLTFGLGEVVKIAPRVLAEQCLFMTFAAKEISKSAVEYAIRKGVEIKKKTPSE